MAAPAVVPFFSESAVFLHMYPWCGGGREGGVGPLGGHVPGRPIFPSPSSSCQDVAIVRQLA